MTFPIVRPGLREPAAPAVSVVIPAYNEARRLPPFLRDASAYLGRTHGSEYEIVVVDDGSRDATGSMLDELRSGWPQLRCLHHAVNQGKGAAVRTGMLAARGRLLLFADADGAAGIEEEQKLRDAIEAGADIAVGARPARAGRRRLAGSLFAALARLVLRPPVVDTQCGFKMFRARAARRLFALCDEQGYLFDLQLLLLAEALRLSIAEVGILWHDVEGSQIRLWRDPWVMLLGLLRVRRSIGRLLDADAARQLAEALEAELVAIRLPVPPAAEGGPVRKAA